MGCLFSCQILKTKTEATVNHRQEGNKTQPAIDTVCQYKNVTTKDDNKGPHITTGIAKPNLPSTVKIVFQVSPKAKWII